MHKTDDATANAATGTDGVVQRKMQPQRETVRDDATSCVIDFETSESQNDESPARNDSMRGIAMSSVERLTGIEPATFSLGSGVSEGVRGDSSVGCGKADCACCNARCNAAGSFGLATEFGPMVEALAGLDAAERARVAAHLAALVAMTRKRRGAILGLTADS